MFRKNSLIFRISLLGAAITALAITVMGVAVIWIFTLSAQRILDNHLMAYADIIVSRVRINGAVSLQDDAGLLDKLPRYWQVSENGQPLFRSANLAEAMPLKAEDVQAPQRVEWKSAGALVVTFKAAGSVATPLVGRTIWFLPRDDKGVITWRCVSDAPAKYCPSSCTCR